MRSVSARLDDLGRDQGGVLVDVDEDRRRAHGGDRLGGRDEAVGRHDDLVAGADAERPQGQLERAGAGGDADRVIGLAPGGELALEGLELLAKGEGGAAGDPLDRGEDVRGKGGVGGVEAHEGHAGCRLGGRRGL